MMALEVQVEHPEREQGKKNEQRLTHRDRVDGKHLPAYNKQCRKDNPRCERGSHPPAEDAQQKRVEPKEQGIDPTRRPQGVSAEESEKRKHRRKCRREMC